MVAAANIPAGEYVPTADHRIVLAGATWEHYELELAMRGEKSVPRFAYLEGALELMSPSRDHERITSYLGRLIEVYAEHADIELSPYRSWTLKAGRTAGGEPDECYIVGADQSKDRPDLVIEVIWTSGGIDKLAIYQRLGIDEVWFWDRRSPRVLEDALDGAMLESAEPRGVPERGVEIRGGVASAQHEDAARLVAPDPWRARAQQPEERGRPRTQAVERHGELIEIHRALAARRWMEARRVELEPEAARRELVASDARQVGGVDEQLVLGDAHRQDVGHVVVGNGVAIAFPVDEAVDAAHAIEDARGVVGVARQRHEPGLLLGKPLEARAAVAAPRVDDPVEPVDELGACRRGR
jgi:Uma2 family endonuclease